MANPTRLKKVGRTLKNLIPFVKRREAQKNLESVLIKNANKRIMENTKVRTHNALLKIGITSEEKAQEITKCMIVLAEVQAKEMEAEAFGRKPTIYTPVWNAQHKRLKSLLGNKRLQFLREITLPSSERQVLGASLFVERLLKK